MHLALLTFALTRAPEPANLPPVCLADLGRFPAKGLAARSFDLAKARADCLGRRLWFSDIAAGDAAAWCDQEARLLAWQLLVQAQSEGYSREYRLGKLWCLRQLIGVPAYYAGEMLAPWPWWTFEMRP